jgi:hypothetical protein
MVLDYWAHAHLDDPKLRNEVVADDYEEQRAEMEAQVSGSDAPVKADYADRLAALKARLKAGDDPVEAAAKALPAPPGRPSDRPVKASSGKVVLPPSADAAAPSRPRPGPVAVVEPVEPSDPEGGDGDFEEVISTRY